MKKGKEDKKNNVIIGPGGDTSNNNLENEEEDSRLARLFEKLDVNGDGRITISDLSTYLTSITGGRHAPKSPHLTSVIKRFFKKSDLDSSGDITLEEFLNYARKHEKNLRLIFTEIDRNQDGVIELGEVMRVVREQLGVDHDQGGKCEDEDHVRELLGRMSKTSHHPHPHSLELKISWEDWRDYLILTPLDEGDNHPLITALPEILKYWRHATYLDVGEDTAVPDDFTKDEFQTGMWWRHLVAGGVAGMVSRTATAPLDRIKVWLQVHGAHASPSSPTNLGLLRSTLRTMLAEGGVASLWRGNGINVLKIAPESAFKFMAYEQGKRWLKGDDMERELEMQERFVAGSLAGAISQSLIYPLEVVKTRLALRKTGQYTSLLHLITSMYRTSGLRIFYRGYIPNLLGILPYAGIDLAVYETLKRKFTSNNNDQPSILILLTCGTLSSACGQVASYPLALVRTRLQATESNRSSMGSLFRGILEREGVVGLYRGMLPNFLKVAPAVSISYVVYEKVRVGLGVGMS